MLEETGFCSGVENYSRHLALREAGSTPTTLMDFFGDDYLLVVDESTLHCHKLEECIMAIEQEK